MRLLAALFLLLAALPARAEERVLDLPTGRGENVMRVLLLAPAGPPRGALVLLAGGDGSLDMTPAGGIRNLGGNQLVRTRNAYVAAGWLVAVPDMPLDTWRGRPYSRMGAEHAAGAGLVLDDDGLAEVAGERLAEGAHLHVRGAAGRPGHHQAQRPPGQLRQGG